MVTRVALPLCAILVLEADARDIAVLEASVLLPGVVLGLFAGVWIDRVRRRRVMIVSDWARVAVLLWVPAAATFGVLSLSQLWGVGLVLGAFTFLFDVAQPSYVPSLVAREQLVEANSRLTGGGAVAEAGAFASSGWLVQWLTAPFALLVDASTFVVSGILLATIRKPESRVGSAQKNAVSAEIAEGLRVVWRVRELRALGIAALLLAVGGGAVGTLYMLFAVRQLGFDPGWLGLLIAVGSVSSLAGATLAPRLGARFGIGRTMAVAATVGGGALFLLPLAPDAAWIGALCLAGQQLFGDGAITAYEIHSVSLRQLIAEPELLGRVNATFRIGAQLGMLLGTGFVGVFADAWGLRALLVGGASVSLLGGAVLLLSPVRSFR